MVQVTTLLTRAGMAPYHFHGIQIRRVRWQPFDNDPAMLPDPGFDLFCPMGLPTIPNQSESFRQMSPQPLKESKHFFAANVVRILSPVKTQPPTPRCDRNRADGREPITTVPLTQEGRLPSRRPRTPNHRLEHKAALIDKDHVSTGSFGVFLYGATAFSATFRLQPRPFLSLGAPASDNSSLHPGAPSIHVRGDTEPQRYGR